MLRGVWRLPFLYLYAPPNLPVSITLQHIPADMEFNAADDSFTSPETSVKIRGGSSIRLKVLGATILATTQTAIGTINEPFLGFHT